MKEVDVVVPNYGCGNLASVRRICERIGRSCQIVEGPDELRYAKRVILAGVGAFDHGMSRLQERGFVDALAERRQAGVPILGICLGMQLLCRRSDEGTLPGLAFMQADVRRFQLPVGSPLKVPHMAWADLAIAQDNPLLPQSAGPQRFYFVHSYHVVCDAPADVIAYASHGDPFVAAFGHAQLFGVQFHPEKSHRFGMALLDRFFAL